MEVILSGAMQVVMAHVPKLVRQLLQNVSPIWLLTSLLLETVQQLVLMDAVEVPNVPMSHVMPQASLIATYVTIWSVKNALAMILTHVRPISV
jgi:hypothetical protein